MNINNDYLNMMQDLLKEEYEAYYNLLSLKPYTGIRINTNRISINDYKNIFYDNLKESPFCDNGFYINKEEGIGYSDEHMINAFYIQEPSASSSVTILNPLKGSKVLDICASPGSKSTQILEKLDNTGLLVCNETINSRVSALKDNINKYACNNAVIISEDTSKIADKLSGVFDYVLCDAPCSGEGMFRKSEAAIKQWSKKYVLSCKALQKEIINNAWQCLRENGEMVYSTCTFNKHENEEVIEEFLNEHDDAILMDINEYNHRKSFPIGKYGYGARIFPMDGGEGHFVAKLKKIKGDNNTLKVLKDTTIDKNAKEFINDFLIDNNYFYYQNNNKIYLGNNPFFDYGVRTIQNQTYVGEINKGIFKPSHEFMSSNYLNYKYVININKEELDKYLHGDTLNIEKDKGWYVLKYKGICVGGVKSDGKQLKNHYPKQFRRN